MDRKITKEAGATYDLLHPLLDVTYKEIKELSKKNPDSPLNAFKVKSINRVLEPIKELLQFEDTAPFLDILDSDFIPTNSDVVMILSQYMQSMQLYKDQYYFWDRKDGEHKWRT